MTGIPLPRSTSGPIAAASSPLLISGAMLSDVGCRRESNEDAVVYHLDDGAGELLAIVADGMGGHLAGEVASQLAVETLSRLYLAGDGAPPGLLADCMASANRAIYDKAIADPSCAGMGTTCTALAIRDGVAFLAHIGDSRAYLWRHGTLHQMSDDQTVVAAMVRDGTLTEAEAAYHPAKSMLLQALGTHPQCDPTIWVHGFPVAPGDRWVLCSDGLYDVLAHSIIAQAVAAHPPIEACRVLIRKTLAAGAPDNVSVGVFSIETTSHASNAEVRNST
jgi:protein phosphatase